MKKKHLWQHIFKKYSVAVVQDWIVTKKIVFILKWVKKRDVYEHRTFGVCNITPNAENVSYNNFSSTSGSKFPMNTFAPTSRFFWWADAWKQYHNDSIRVKLSMNRGSNEFPRTLLTRMGLPYNFIMFIILIA